MIIDDWTTSGFLNDIEFYATKGNPGGGAYLLTSGLFSVMNFLGKVNYLLDNDYSINDEILEVIPKSLKLLKERLDLKDFKFFKKAVEKKRKDFINECEAFVRLIEQSPIIWKGINKESPEGAEVLRKLWRSYRNGFSHMGIPNTNELGVINSLGVVMSSSGIWANDMNIRGYFPYCCNNELLLGDVKKIVEFIKEKIESRENNDPGIVRLSRFFFSYINFGGWSNLVRGMLIDISFECDYDKLGSNEEAYLDELIDKYLTLLPVSE
jgi:hypothetical protein